MARPWLAGYEFPVAPSDAEIAHDRRQLQRSAERRRGAAEHGSGCQDGWIVPRLDAGAGVTKRLEAPGRRCLRVVVVGEHREPVVVEPGGEVGDVTAEDELRADANRLVARGVPRRKQQLDGSVPE